MTKTLLVNCSLKTSNEQLRQALVKFSECNAIHFKDINEAYHLQERVDAIVVSGSAARIVDPFYQVMFQDVAAFIKGCELPLLGICYGHQLICWAFGAKVGSLPQQVIDCFENIQVVVADELFDGFKEGQMVPLAENHFDYVLKNGLDGTGFSLLANSASCEVEAVKHKTKPFYGVQFHPERIAIKNEKHSEGHRIIENFYIKTVKR